ncbi:MAG: HDOD domain-containing protein [Congregibacter sp.]
MNCSPEELAEKVETLTTFSDVAFKIDRALADDHSNAVEIGRLIETDPALSAALLRVANSAAYGARKKIDNTADALTFVGSRHVRDLAYGVSASKAFEGIPNDLLSPMDFWKHSLYSAVAAQMLANTARLCRGTSLFTAGLLHDIGHLVMFSQAPELSREALERYLDQDEVLPISAAEHEIFGFDHMEVGAALARSWEFPDTLLAAIMHHHDPSACTEHADVALIVHVANSLAVLAELGSENIEDAPEIDKASLDALNIDDESILIDMAVDISRAANDLLGVFVS